MYQDYCLDIEETSICFEISNSPSTIIWRPAPNSWPVAQLVEHRTSTEGRGFVSHPGQVDLSLLVRYGSSLGETPRYYSLPEFTVP